MKGKPNGTIVNRPGTKPMESRPTTVKPGKEKPAVLVPADSTGKVVPDNKTAPTVKPKTKKKK